MAKRFLSAQITDRQELTENGFLKAHATLTRVGVFKYRDKKGNIVRELRHPDDVFSPESLRTLEMVPLTNNHPREFVSSKNLKQHTIGWIGENIEHDDLLVKGAAIVADEKAIGDVSRGKTELSCGYNADLKSESGVYNGEAYDCRQVNIKYNHVALVDRGRAGPQVRLRLDSDDAVEESIEIVNNNKPNQNGGTGMKTIRIDGVDYEVSESFFKAYENAEQQRKDAEIKTKKNDEEMKDELGKLKEKLKASQDEAKKLQDQIAKYGKGGNKNDSEDYEKMVAENDKLQARIDSLEEKIGSQKTDADEINKLVTERRRIEDTAFKVIGKEFKKDSSNMEIKKEIIKKHSDKCDLEGKSDDYVNARFDSIAEDVEGVEDRAYQLTKPVVKNDKGEETRVDAEESRTKMHEDSKELWKQPLTSSNRS